MPVKTKRRLGAVTLRTIDHKAMLATGTALIRAKGRLRHGEWLLWLEKNFDGSPWLAQAYMRIAEAEKASPGCLASARSLKESLKIVRRLGV